MEGLILDGVFMGLDLLAVSLTLTFICGALYRLTFTGFIEKAEALRNSNIKRSLLNQKVASRF